MTLVLCMSYFVLECLTEQDLMCGRWNVMIVTMADGKTIVLIVVGECSKCFTVLWQVCCSCIVYVYGAYTTLVPSTVLI